MERIGQSVYLPCKLDLQTYEQTFMRYYSGLIVYAVRFVFSGEVAEDIVHDIFEVLWEKRDEIDPLTVKSYLYSSVRNRSLNYLRDLRVRDQFQEKVLAKGEPDGELSWEFYVEGELEELLKKIMDELPPRAREIILMNRIEGRRAQDIADELGISRRTVEKHIEVALKFLRTKLERYPFLWLLFFS